MQIAKQPSASGGFAPNHGLCPWIQMWAQTSIIGSLLLLIMCRPNSGPDPPVAINES